MKKFGFFVFALAEVVSLGACGAAGGNGAASSDGADSSDETGSNEAASGNVTGSQQSEQRQISVQFDGGSVVYALNNGTAADSLYAQLPLTIQVEDFSTNEKIFYPPQELDTSDSPLAQAGAGTLAYYEPWGDVVLFYGAYNENPSLF